MEEWQEKRTHLEDWPRGMREVSRGQVGQTSEIPTAGATGWMTEAEGPFGLEKSWCKS